MTQELSTNIQIFKDADRAAFLHLINDFNFQDVEYYEHCITRQAEGDMVIVLAKGVGFCLLNFAPKYARFKVIGVAEIQDLNVLTEHRCKGVGMALIQFCEKYLKDKGHDEVGIGVGLDRSFGAAQRLYARLGYIPDGDGVTYDRKQVATGEFRPIDANLSLMMTKGLK